MLVIKRPENKILHIILVIIVIRWQMISTQYIYIVVFVWAIATRLLYVCLKFKLTENIIKMLQFN